MAVSKVQIVELLRKNDKAIARALLVLNERQTSDEQASEHTKYRNGRGFRPCHARMGTSMAGFYARRGFLSTKQIAYWRMKDKTGKMRIEIYAGQLVEVAEEKAGVKATVVALPQAALPLAAPTIHLDTLPATAPMAIVKNHFIGIGLGNLMETKMVIEEAMGGDIPDRVRAAYEFCIQQIQEAAAIAVAEDEKAMQKLEAEGDATQTRIEEHNKFLARCRMEGQK